LSFVADFAVSFVALIRPAAAKPRLILLSSLLRYSASILPRQRIITGRAERASLRKITSGIAG
jgi:hypothetical protein